MAPFDVLIVRVTSNTSHARPSPYVTCIFLHEGGKNVAKIMHRGDLNFLDPELFAHVLCSCLTKNLALSATGRLREVLR